MRFDGGDSGTDGNLSRAGDDDGRRTSMRCFSFLLTVCGSVGLLVAVLLIYFCIRYRRRPGDSATPPLTPSSRCAGVVLDDHAVLHLHRDVLLGRGRLRRRLSRPRRGDPHLCRRQTMDVEVPASGGAARDQHAARAARAAGSNPVDVGRRDPQLLRPRLPRAHGRLAQPLHVGLVPADAAGDVSPVLLAVLRDEPCGHDRDGRRDGAGRVRELALARTPKARSRSKGARCF